MGGVNNSGLLSPNIAPISVNGVFNVDKEEHWRRNYNNSVDAVSFGFVATAILISLFLIMALFEKFLRLRSSASGSGRLQSGDLEAPVMVNGKLRYPSPKVNMYAKEASVLMPGEELPTYIAYPAPAPCPPEPISRPLYQQYTFTEVYQSLIHNP